MTSGPGDEYASAMLQNNDFDDESGIALTPMQLAMLSESSIAGQPWVNLEQIVVHFAEGQADESRIRTALLALMERHDALRMKVQWNMDGRPCQIAVTPGNVPLANVTIDAAPDKDGLHSFLDTDRTRGIDVTDGLPWRASLLHRDQGAAATLVLTIHHAFADGRSMALLVRELNMLLAGADLLPVADPGFADFCGAVTDSIPNADRADAYFKAALKHVDDAGSLSLPKLNTPEPRAIRKRQARRHLPPAQRQQLTDLAQRNGATLANVIQAAWGVLLSRWQGRGDVTFGIVRSGRHAVAGTRDTVGCLINTLPARVTPGPDQTVSHLLAALRDHTLALHSLEQTPPDLIRRAAGLHGAQPLFETAIMFENAGIEALALGDATPGPANGPVIGVELFEEGGLPLMLSVYAEDRVAIMLEHDPSRVSDDMAGHLFDDLLRLLEAFARAEDSTKIGALDMHDAATRQTLLDWSAPDQPLGETGTCLVRRFRDSVQRDPDAVALEQIGLGAQLSYAELDRRSDALANVLQGMGAGAGSIVAVNLGRSPDFVLAVLAVLKVGAAFMPVDPAYPQAARQHMLDDSGARIVIDATFMDRHRAARSPDASLPLPAEDTSALAYVIYTSGSTGKPKGVKVSRGNLLSHLTALIGALDLAPGDRTLQFAGLSFDVAVEEVFTALMSGATLVLRDDEMAQSASAFLDHVGQNSLSVLNIPTAFWTVLTQYMRAGGHMLPPCVRLVIVGGERVSPQTLSDWRAVAPAARWLNGYGPTETTITCTLHDPGDHPEDQEVPIGRPTAHARAYVISPDASLAPMGAQGELAIGGPAVTQGYIDRPEETTQAFLPNPFGAPGRIYRSGDRAFWLDSGHLGFAGRKDRQVKLRGFRIDLRHVERAIESCLPGADILCDVLDKNTPSARLTAWIASAQTPDLEAIAASLTHELPAHMRPALLHMPEFPRTAGGKIDRNALPRPDQAAAPVEASDATALEATICNAMAKVLKLPHVYPNQSFFDLGGHSLLSIELIGRIELATGRKLGIADFNANPSPRAVAAVLESGRQSSRHIIPIQPEGNKPPLLAIHILGANEEYFRPMAEHLGNDQPIMGVSVGSLDENTPTGIEYTAGRYCADINQHYPTGPIHLMAVSLGSYMAFELARQLKESGREVGLLAFFDAAGPGGRGQVSGWRRIVAHLRRARYTGWGYPAQILRNRIHNLRNTIASRQIKRVSNDGETHAPKTVFEFIASNELAVQQYTPRPLDVPITIFRAESDFMDTAETKASGLGWAPVAQAGYEVIDVPGGHLSMLQPPNITTLAARMQDALDRFPAQTLAPRLGHPAGPTHRNRPPAPFVTTPQGRPHKPAPPEQKSVAEG